jgi:hypothetical protein
MALLSPGVQVSVIDQSNYTPAAASSTTIYAYWQLLRTKSLAQVLELLQEHWQSMLTNCI